MMPKLRLPKKIESTFALVEIGTGRREIANLIAADHKIPITLHGYLIPGKSNIGSADNVGTEFAAHVESISVDTPEFVALDRGGRPWAMAKDVKAGDKLQCDSGFTCMKEGTRKTVKAHGYHFYVPCKDGKHYLKGQEGDHGELIGLYKVGS